MLVEIHMVVGLPLVDDFLFPMSRDILNFLREGELPHRDRVRAVYREAQYYAIGPLLDNLEDIQPLTGEKVRQSFLDLLPYYKGDHTYQGERCIIDLTNQDFSCFI